LGSGLKEKVYGPGYNLKLPLIEVSSSLTQQYIIYDCRLKPIDISVSTGTKDLQTVSISLRILHQPIIEALPTIHKLMGREYDRKIFDSIGQ
jgi:prohibitin 1